MQDTFYYPDDPITGQRLNVNGDEPNSQLPKHIKPYMYNNTNRKHDLKEFHKNFVMNCGDDHKNTRSHAENERFADKDRRKSDGIQADSNRIVPRRSLNKV